MQDYKKHMEYMESTTEIGLAIIRSDGYNDFETILNLLNQAKQRGKEEGVDKISVTWTHEFGYDNDITTTFFVSGRRPMTDEEKRIKQDKDEARKQENIERLREQLKQLEGK